MEMSIPKNDQYVATIRRSYTTLVNVSNVLEAARPSDDARSHLRDIAQTVASFVHRLIWADGLMQPAETMALDALLAEDAPHGGLLAEAIRGGAAMNDENPQFLGDCRDYDRANGTRLTGSAINALESMGLALLATDREIVIEEMSMLQDMVSRWRDAAATVVAAP